MVVDRGQGELPYSPRPGAAGTRKVIKKVNPLPRPGLALSDAIEPPEEETSRAATNRASRRSTAGVRASNAAGVLTLVKINMI